MTTSKAVFLFALIFFLPACGSFGQGLAEDAEEVAVAAAEGAEEQAREELEGYGIDREAAIASGDRIRIAAEEAAIEEFESIVQRRSEEGSFPDWLMIVLALLGVPVGAGADRMWLARKAGDVIEDAVDGDGGEEA